MITALFLALLAPNVTGPVQDASFYTQRLDDPKAVYLAPSGGDDTIALQGAINRVSETTRQGIVLLAPGRYALTNTVYIWPGNPPDRLRRAAARHRSGE